MIESSEKSARLRALAKEKLKIYKVDRLVGENGYVNVPPVPSMFYLNEVVIWLLNAIKENKEYNIVQGDYKYDCTIESIGYGRIKKLPESVLNFEPGIYSLSKLGNIKQIEIYKGLTDRQLSQVDSGNEDYSKYSLSHQRFLQMILNTLNKHYGTFVALLSQRNGAPIRSHEEMYADSLKNLRELQNSILNMETAGSFRIPELYGLRDHGVLMSYSLNEVRGFETEEWGLLYTYRFSKETSYFFLDQIKNFVVWLIKKYEDLEIQMRKQNPITLKMPEKVTGELIRMPTATPEKVALILKLLDSDDESMSQIEDEKISKADELSITALMILFRTLMKHKVFRQNLKKWQVGIGYHLLTGKSYSKFESLFQMRELDAETLRKIADSTTLQKSKTAIDSILKKFETEIIPYLRKINT